MSQMTAEKQDELYLPLLDEVVEESLSDYSSKLIYHVRPHGELVIDRNLASRQVVVDAGIETAPSVYVATASAAGHDSGFRRYFTDAKISRQFPSPEDYSIHLSNERQEKRGVDEATQIEIAQGIMGTKVSVRCRTWGQFILCEADMQTTALEDRTVMKEDTEKLRQEHLELKKRDIGDIGFKLLSLGVLATYNQVNLAFPGIAEAGDVFIKRREQMSQNILLMSQDIVDQTGEEIKDLVRRISPPFLKPVLKLLGISKEEIADQKAS